MNFFSLSGALVFIIWFFVASGVSAQVGVAPVSVGKGVEKDLADRLERIIGKAVTQKGADLVPPDVISQNATFSGRALPEIESLSTLVQKLELSAVIAAHVDANGEKIVLTIRTVAFGGLELPEATVKATRGSVERAAMWVASDILDKVDQSIEKQYVAEVDSITGRDLYGRYTRRKKKNPGYYSTYAQWALDLQKRDLRRAKILAGVVSPVVFLGAGAASTFFLVKAVQAEEEREAWEKKWEEEGDDSHANEWGGDLERNMYTFVGLFFMSAAIVGALVPLYLGVTRLKRARENSNLLERLIDKWSDRRVELSLAPYPGWGLNGVLTVAF